MTWKNRTYLGTYQPRAGGTITPLPAASQPGTPLIVRGDGCYVTDAAGRRYLDGLAGMFCVNVGHGRGEIAQAAAVQAAQLGYWRRWPR